MTNIVYIAMSLDGFIAEADGGIGFLESAGDAQEGEDFGWTEFFENIDALVMGRNTYDVFRSFDLWPYEDKKLVVLTNRDVEITDDLKDRVSSFAGSPEETVNHLKSMNCENLYIDGGWVIQDFLNSGLINEMIITIIPILIGDGIALFGSLKEQIKLEASSVKKFENGLIQLHYYLNKEKSSL